MLFSDEDAAVAMFISSPGDEGKVRNNYAHNHLIPPLKPVKNSS